MDVAILVMSHLILLIAGYVFGKWQGFVDAQPERDARGRFKKED